MSTQLGFTPNIKMLLAYSAIAFVFGFFPTQSSQAQTEWTITIDATGNHPKPAGYKVSRKDIGVPCTYTNNNAAKLHVCLNDTVLWTPSTAPDTSGKKKNELFIFHEDPILLDAGNNSVQTLHSSDGTATGGTIDPKASQIEHEYYVVVYDKSNKKWYVEDPKIIIGGTTLDVLLEDLQLSCGKLPNAIDSDPYSTEEAKKRLKEKIDEICERVRKLKNP